MTKIDLFSNALETWMFWYHTIFALLLEVRS